MSISARKQMKPMQIEQMLIRVKKEDSAFVYCILESHEGIVSYSTVDYQVGTPHRDLELTVPLDFKEELRRVLSELGDLIYELPSPVRV